MIEKTTEQQQQDEIDSVRENILLELLRQDLISDLVQQESVKNLQIKSKRSSQNKSKLLVFLLFSNADFNFFLLVYFRS
jgi:hypothetical protein